MGKLVGWTVNNTKKSADHTAEISLVFDRPVTSQEANDILDDLIRRGQKHLEAEIDAEMKEVIYGQTY